MTYRVRIDPIALRQIDEFAAYLHDYSENFAIDQIERLDRTLKVNIVESPLTWGTFAMTGAPYVPTCFVSVAAPNIGSSTP
jgi:hypothetical protein